MSRPPLCSLIFRHHAPATFILAFCLWTVVGLWGQTNAIPFINQPLIPASIAPGSGDFTLKVKGTGFAAGAVLKWNGSSRITIVDSPSRLHARISAADVAHAGTASITVVNPAPGGGTSNIVYFSIRQLYSTVALARRDRNLTSAGGLTAGDFNNDGNLDVVAGDSDGGNIQVFPGDGKGGFEPPIITAASIIASSMLGADVDGDGNLDLIVGDDYDDTLTVLVGDGTGHFIPLPPFPGADSSSVLAVGDCNRDGKLDLFCGGTGPDSDSLFRIYLGNGDGTFVQLQHDYNQDISGPIAIGDFNKDGIVDLAIVDFSRQTVNVFPGNGDGTFQNPVLFVAYTVARAVTAADVNGDGKLDLITSGVSILLGNGDGTFSPGQSISLGDAIADVAMGDFNGDSHLDLMMSATDPGVGAERNLMLLLGNGDGTFQDPLIFASGLGWFGGFAAGDFNNDGRFDVVDGNYNSITTQPEFSLFLQTSASVSPSSLDFGKQQIGTKSAPQIVTLKNIGVSALPINGISIRGADAKAFIQRNQCGSELAPGASCLIKVFFKPGQVGAKLAFLKIAYGDAGSPQKVPLSGIGVNTQVSLTPSKLTFPVQLVGTKSSPQTATLTNVGTEVVTITAIATSGPFIQSNNCGASLNPGASCQIQVQFTPTDPGDANGSLTVTDNAPDSPQQVALTGTGTIVKLSPLSINFGDQPVGTTSPAVPVTLTNKGNVTLNISAIQIVGTNASDFAQTNNCGNSVPPAGSCKIKVTFTPSAQGPRSASLSISDDGGGSPQTVALSGNGT